MGRKAKVDKEIVYTMWLKGIAPEEIANIHGCSVRRVHQLMRERQDIQTAKPIIKKFWGA